MDMDAYPKVTANGDSPESRDSDLRKKGEQAPENLVVCGLVMIDDSRWLPLLPLWTDKDFLK